MTTPICDFVRAYGKKNPVRAHMPGHKGVSLLGCESLDITEMDGADNLYCPEGIIAESEKNASRLFGCRTFYSTEGSSHCIRTMLSLAMPAPGRTERPYVLAARNVHKSFVSAAALLDFDIRWIPGNRSSAVYSSEVTASDVEEALKNVSFLPFCVYLTTPDYLGNISDVKSVAEVCHRCGVRLLVDNAHGAYLGFLEPSLHPVALGADMCCDSAHKTLPALTGGAYLHLAETMKKTDMEVKNTFAMFGSTSPSYLILQSLDKVNEYLDGYPSLLKKFLEKIRMLREKLTKAGYTLCGDEEMKITLDAKSYGYTGTEISRTLEQSGIYCEFADPDYAVLMLTPCNTDDEIRKIQKALLAVPKKNPILKKLFPESSMNCVMTVREACFAEKEILPVSECEGRILAETAVMCPPAVPVLVCGERITKEAMKEFLYYGITECAVVRKTAENTEPHS